MHSGVYYLTANAQRFEAMGLFLNTHCEHKSPWPSLATHVNGQSEVSCRCNSTESAAFLALDFNPTPLHPVIDVSPRPVGGACCCWFKGGADLLLISRQAFDCLRLATEPELT